MLFGWVQEYHRLESGTPQVISIKVDLHIPSGYWFVNIKEYEVEKTYPTTMRIKLKGRDKLIKVDSMFRLMPRHTFGYELFTTPKRLDGDLAFVKRKLQ